MTCSNCKKGYASTIKFPGDLMEYTLCAECSREEFRRRNDRGLLPKHEPKTEAPNIAGDWLDNVGIFTKEGAPNDIAQS